MIQRGFSPVLIIILLALLAVGGYFVYTSLQGMVSEPVLSEVEVVKLDEAISPTTQTPDPTTKPESTSSAETANWKTYTNKELKFSFQYPDEYKLENENDQKVTFSGLFQPGDQVIASELAVHFNPILDLETLENCDDVKLQDNITTKCVAGQVDTKNVNGIQMRVFHIQSGSKNSQSNLSYVYQTINDPKLEFIHAILGGGVQPRVDQILSTFKFTQ